MANQITLEAIDKEINNRKLGRAIENSGAFGNTTKAAPGRFMSGVEGFNAAIEQPVLSLLSRAPGRFGREASNIKDDKLSDLEAAQNANPFFTGAGGVVGAIGRDLPFYMGGGMAAQSAMKSMPAIGQTLSRVSPNMPSYVENIAAAILGGGTAGAARGLLEGKDAFALGEEEGLLAGGVAAALPVAGKLAAPLAPAARAVGEYAAAPFRAASDSFLPPAQKKIKEAKKLLEGLTSGERTIARQNKKLAEEMGLTLTPAEASGSAALAAKEAKIARSEESQFKMNQFKEGQKKKQAKVVDEFVKSAGPKPDADINIKFRDEAKRALEAEKQARAKKAEPFYKAANKDEISERSMQKLMSDDVIKNAYKQVSKDPVYKKELKNVNPFSVEYADTVKKYLNAQASRASGIEGRDRFAAKSISDSANKITKTFDKISPDYKKARKIFAEDSPAIQKLENSELGKIANMSDLNAKNIQNIVFDSNQFNNKNITELRDAILKTGGKKGREIWDKMTRQQIEKKLDTANMQKMETSGTNFQNQIGKTSNQINQLNRALGDNEAAKQKLKAMRKVFKNLVNARTVKGNAGRSENNMDLSRNTIDAAINMFHKFFNANNEKETVRMLTTGEWGEAFKALDRSGTPEALLRKMAEMAGKTKDRLTIEIKKGTDQIPDWARKGASDEMEGKKLQMLTRELERQRRESTK